MRKLKADVVLIGSGTATMLAASRLHTLGIDTLVLNPNTGFHCGDLRPRHGTSLWTAAYQSRDAGVTLSDLYDVCVDRLREVFPATVETSGLARTECWSVLSSTPVHRERTQELEKEFFKVERKAFSQGQFRLVNHETIEANAKPLGIDFKSVAQIDGAVRRSYGLIWDAVEISHQLALFMRTKFADRVLYGADIVKRHGKRFAVETPDGEEILVEASRSAFVMFTGDLLPDLREVIAGCSEPWIQAVRKRRRERLFAWFEKERGIGPSPATYTGTWFDLGDAHYCCNENGALACWSVRGGPDGLDRMVDEGLRLQAPSGPISRFVRSEREFWLEWDWRAPSWRSTAHDLYWATSFEGDLPATLELLWTIPTV